MVKNVAKAQDKDIQFIVIKQVKKVEKYSYLTRWNQRKKSLKLKINYQ